MRPHPTPLPRRMFCTLSYLRPALLAFLLLTLLFLGGGCTEDQLALAGQQTSSLQEKINQTSGQLTELQNRIAAEKAVLATQPATTQAVEQLNKDQANAAKLQGWLDKATPVLQQVSDGVTALKNGETPNFGGLGIFGPYGLLAGLVLSVGFGAYQTFSKGKVLDTANAQAQTIAAQQPVIDHIQEATGTTNPVTAAAALTAVLPPPPPVSVTVTAPTPTTPVVPPGPPAAPLV